MKKCLRSIFSTSDATCDELKPRSPMMSPSRGVLRDTNDMHSPGEFRSRPSRFPTNINFSQSYNDAVLSRHDAIKLEHRSESDYGSMSFDLEYYNGNPDTDSVFGDDDSSLNMKFPHDCMALKSPTSSSSITSFLFRGRHKSSTLDVGTTNVRLRKFLEIFHIVVFVLCFVLNVTFASAVVKKRAFPFPEN